MHKYSLVHVLSLSQSRRDLRQIENLDLTVLDTPPTRVTNTSQVDDLFSAHDFDINIDLPQETQGQFICSLYISSHIFHSL